MIKSVMNPKVDFYFSKVNKWQSALEQLRIIVLDCGLAEELKWGVPCYTFQNGNIFLIHVFKEYCALLFFKGALLHDAAGILIQQTANVQAGRQIRFTNVQEIGQMEAILKAYIYEAIEVEKAGLPGRQRAYNLYFSAPKQSKTRESRIEKCMQQMLDGKGLNDE